MSILSNNSPGLIAAYQCNAGGVSKGILVNKKENITNTFNITLLQTSVLSDSIYFNGKSSRSNSIIAIGNFKTIQFYFKPTVNNIDIIQLSGSGKISINSSNLITVTGLSIPEIWINGYLNGSVELNQWNTITIRTNTLFNTSAFILGYSSSYFKGYIKDLIINKDYIDYRDYHNYFASKIVLKETFQYPVDNFVKGQGNWNKISGVFTIAESTNPTLLPKAKKYLKCTTAGIITLPTISSRYGTISAKLLKGADANVLDFIFSSNQNKGLVTGNTGYLLRYDSDEKFKLYTFNGTTLTQIGSSSILVYPINIFHKVRIEAKTDNTWKVFVNNQTIITGTNSTYTLSKYLVLDFDANDSITDLTIKQGITI